LKTAEKHNGKVLLTQNKSKARKESLRFFISYEYQLTFERDYENPPTARALLPRPFTFSVSSVYHLLII
jgi:hypothetical protein